MVAKDALAVVTACLALAIFPSSRNPSCNCPLFFFGNFTPKSHSHFARSPLIFLPIFIIRGALKITSSDEGNFFSS